MNIGIAIAGDTLSALDIINSSQTFYNDAWGNLITFLSIAGGLIIIVIPILFALWQQSQLQIQKKDLLDSFKDVLDNRSAELQNDKDIAVRDLEAKLNDLKCQLETTGADIEERNRLALSQQEEIVKAKINDELTSRVNEIDKQITEVKAEALGGIFHLQGNMSGTNLISKLDNYCRAISFFSVSNNWGAASTLLKIINARLKIIAENKDVSIQYLIPMLDQVPSDIDRMKDKERLIDFIPVFEDRLSQVKAMLAAEPITPPDVPPIN